MTVSYDELNSSPKLKVARDSSQATRIFLIDWDDIEAFVDELFPSPLEGYGGQSYYPSRPWLVAQSASFEPFDPDNPSGCGEAINVYPGGARVTVEYGIPKDDQKQGPTEGDSNGDGTGPGGDQGSTGGETGNDDQKVTHVRHDVSIAGEMLTLPNSGLKWANPDDQGSTDAGTEANAGKTIPLIEHQITWSHVQSPPWANIRACIGRVNNGNFCGAAAETVLFLGCEAFREISSDGASDWEVKYKFAEKNTSMNGDDVEGWNHFFRPSSGNFERLQTKHGGQIYKEADMTALYNSDVAAF